MSTKIYNAYWLKDYDIQSAMQMLQAFKLDTLRPLAETLKAKVLAQRAVAMLDRVTLGWDTEVQNYVSVAWREIKEEQKNVKLGNREPDVDFGFETSLIVHAKNIYMTVHTEQPLYLKAWEAIPNIMDFSYWNNTDKPDDVSAKDWARRKKVWSTIFSGSVRCPDDAGIGINLLSVEGSWKWPKEEDILANVPTLDERVERHHLDAAARELLGKIDPDDPFSKIMSLHRDPRYKEIGEKLRAVLPTDINWSHITGQTPMTLLSVTSDISPL